MPEDAKADAPVVAEITEEAKEETPAVVAKEEGEEKLDATYTTLATEATDNAVEEADDEVENKYVLLDRLFKFIRTEPEDKEELNPVLSGYFCKLVSILISRKCRQLVPYVFSPGSDLI